MRVYQHPLSSKDITHQWALATTEQLGRGRLSFRPTPMRPHTPTLIWRRLSLYNSSQTIDRVVTRSLIQLWLSCLQERQVASCAAELTEKLPSISHRSTAPGLQLWYLTWMRRNSKWNIIVNTKARFMFAGWILRIKVQNLGFQSKSPSPPMYFWFALTCITARGAG